jgi:hypothetical protein
MVQTLAIPVVVATAGTDITGVSFKAHWALDPPSPPVLSYRLDVNTNSTFTGTWIVNDLNVGSATDFTLTLLQPDQDYFYRVRGVNGVGTGVSSNVIMIHTLPTPRAPVALEETLVSCTAIDANWIPAPGDPNPATSFVIDIATTPTFDPGTFFSFYNDFNVGNVHLLFVDGLYTFKPYYYRLRGVNSYGEGPNSNVITVNL